MFSPSRIPPKNAHERIQKISNTTLDDNSNREDDIKRPQITSKEPVIQKSKLKGGGNFETKDNCLDENLHNNNL